MNQILELITLSTENGTITIIIPGDWIFLLHEDLIPIYSLGNGMLDSIAALLETNNIDNFYRSSQFTMDRSFPMDRSLPINPFTQCDFHNGTNLFFNFKDIVLNIGKRTFIYVDPIHFYVNVNNIKPLFLGGTVMICLIIKGHVISAFYAFFIKLDNFILKGFSSIKSNFISFSKYLKKPLEKNLNFLVKQPKEIFSSTVPGYLRNFTVMMGRKSSKVSLYSPLELNLRNDWDTAVQNFRYSVNSLNAAVGSLTILLNINNLRLHPDVTAPNGVGVRPINNSATNTDIPANINANIQSVLTHYSNVYRRHTTAIDIAVNMRQQGFTMPSLMVLDNQMSRARQLMGEYQALFN